LARREGDIKLGVQGGRKEIGNDQKFKDLNIDENPGGKQLNGPQTD